MELWFCQIPGTVGTPTPWNVFTESALFKYFMYLFSGHEKSSVIT